MLKKIISGGRKIGAFFRTKYIEIILAVGLFILLDTGVLIINFYISYQIPKDAHAIQLASRMGALTQRMLQQLHQVRELAMDPEADYSGAVDDLARSFKRFDETLDSFVYGGSLIGEGQGQDSLLEDTTYRDANARLLKEVEATWKAYRGILTPVVYSYFRETSRAEIVEGSSKAIAHARKHDKKLTEMMDDFAKAVEGVAHRKARRLRMIQSIGISVAILNFFLILFHFLRKLRQGDALLDQSRKETEDILKNVDEGLFLLDRDFIIGSRCSDSMKRLFQRETFDNVHFLDLLNPLVTRKTLELVEDYTEVLFSARVHQKLILDLNPLTEVEINLATESAEFETRYFSFEFTRVYEKKERFEHILVAVKDVTQYVMLKQKFRETNEKASREIDYLLGIMHVDSSLLNEFLNTSRGGLNAINSILKSPVRGSGPLKDKLRTIARIVHKIKGDGTALGVDFVEKKIDDFETGVHSLMERAEMSGRDFLPLVVELNKLMTDFDAIGELQNKITGFRAMGLFAPGEAKAAAESRSTAPAIEMNKGEQVKKQFHGLVARVAAQQKKEAALHLKSFDLSELSSKLESAVRDIVIQCLRNAVVHGLEPPALREKLGKQRRGSITVSMARDDAAIRLVIRDDGGGLDLDRIRQKAIESRLVTEKQLAGSKPGKLISLIFREGFSTSDAAGPHAGRGVGLDLIKSRLDEIGGSVKVGTQKGQFTEFRFILKKDFPIPKAIAA